MLSKKKILPRWHFCKESTENEMISVYYARIPHFCHFLSSYEHFTVNECMFGGFFPDLAARIRVKICIDSPTEKFGHLSGRLQPGYNYVGLTSADTDLIH